MASVREVKTAQGERRYRVQVRLKGYPTQSATFERLTDARRWGRETETRILEGRHFQTVEAKRHTVAEMIQRYREEEIPSKGGYGQRQAQMLTWWEEKLGRYLLSDLTPALLSEAKGRLRGQSNGRGGTYGPATVNRYLAALSHVLTVATNQWQWLEVNPIQKVQKMREPRGRVRFLSESERVRLLAACEQSSNPYLLPVVVLGIFTGMRKGEITGLRRQDVDLEKRWAILHETKNDERRAVPLAGPALEVVTELLKVRRLDTDLLFPSKVDPSKPMDLRAPWEAALAEAEIEDFRFHDLRHTAASYYAMAGATLNDIKEILGHKTLAMVTRYAHLTSQHRLEVADRMAEKFGG